VAGSTHFVDYLDYLLDLEEVSPSNWDKIRFQFMLNTNHLKDKQSLQSYDNLHNMAGHIINLHNILIEDLPNELVLDIESKFAAITGVNKTARPGNQKYVRDKRNLAPENLLNTDFWNLAASIYDFIAQLIPNFFAVDESRQEILDFRSQITKLIAKYRPLYNSMLKISSSLADKVISLVSTRKRKNST